MSQTGSEGCVIIPSLKTTDNQGYVTKLFYNKDSKAKELSALELFKSSHLDDAQEFTITSYDEQPISVPKDISKKCNGEVSGLFVNYRYGGQTIKSILDKPRDVFQLKSVIQSLIPLSQFVDTMNKKGFYHNDLHSANIVYDDVTKKSRLIDFGNLVKKADPNLPDDFSFGVDGGIFRILNSAVNKLISEFGEDETNITDDEHARYGNFLSAKVGVNKQKMVDAITKLSGKGGYRRKTKRSKRKGKQLHRR